MLAIVLGSAVALFFRSIVSHVAESPDDFYFPKSGGSTFLKSAETKLLLTRYRLIYRVNYRVYGSMPS